MDEDEDDLQSYLERALTVNRRSVFYIDETLQDISGDLFKNISDVDELNDENLVKAVAKTLHENDAASSRIDALSLEVRPKSDDQSQASDYAVTFTHSIGLTPEGDIVNLTDPDPEHVVSQLLDDVLDSAVEISESKQPLELYFYHPLANRDDIDKMTETFINTRATLTDQATKLKTAMKIILVMSAKQIVVSYRRILLEQAERIAGGDDPDEVTRDTCERCLNVTEQVAELAVIYLKNATRDVIDTSVNDVRIILGRMSDDNNESQIEEVTKL